VSGPALLAGTLVLAAVWLAGTRAGPDPARRLRAALGHSSSAGCVSEQGPGLDTTAGSRLRSFRPRGPARRFTGRDPTGADPALVLELVAAAMSAGAHPAAALGVVGAAVGGDDGSALRGVADRMHLGGNGDAAWAAAPPWCGPLRSALELSARTGAPATRLLQDRAQDVRRRRRRRQQAVAQRLGVQVVLPLGLCALPGFAAWGVVPVVLALARDVLGG